jgi:hypothetical protein
MQTALPTRRFSMTELIHTPTGSRDFDFLLGGRIVRNRRLRERLAGCDEWDEFEATCFARPVLGGIGNVEEFSTEWAGGIGGLSLRLFDQTTGKWYIYWTDTRRCGELEAPVVGTFSDGTGIFEGPDVLEGRPVLVRYSWLDTTSATPRWEQALSDDGGLTWETNWIAWSTPAGDAS